MDKDLGNFIHKLPGGYLRDCEIQNGLVSDSSIEPPSRDQLFKDIDTVIAEHSDITFGSIRTVLSAFYDVQRDSKQQIADWSMPPNSKYGDMPTDESKAVLKAYIDKKCRPLYETLMEMGYSESDLKL